MKPCVLFKCVQGLNHARNGVYSPNCILSAVWDKVTIVSGKDPGESTWRGLNIEVLLNNGGEAYLYVSDLKLWVVVLKVWWYLLEDRHSDESAEHNR